MLQRSQGSYSPKIQLLKKALMVWAEIADRKLANGKRGGGEHEHVKFMGFRGSNEKGSLQRFEIREDVNLDMAVSGSPRFRRFQRLGGC
jgi:hypothetical protein